MIAKKSLKNRLKSAIFGVFFAILSIFGFTTISAFVNPPTNVYAEPADTDSSSDTIKNLLTPGSNPPTTNSQNTENTTANPSGNPSDASADGTSTDSSNQTANPQTTDNCYSQVGALGWFICPGVGVLSKAIDSIYSQIEVLLQVNPVSVEGDSPLFYVWQIMRDITNILFVIALLIVIYSQVTGIGITNYGIKKALPKLIIAAVLVNLSFILCALAVDASNIIGSGLRGIFDNIQTQAINSGGLSSASTITWTDLATALISGGVVAGFVISASSLLFPILGAVLCAIISVLVGLITLGLRQSLVSVLIMISPVAFICYLLPNTEKWFSKWREVFISMLIFYPLFSLLFGASRLAGWTLITTSIANDNAFGVAIGMVVQVLPLVLSISLMKMSGTILGKVSSGLDKLADIPRGGIRDTAKRYRQFAHDNRINTSASPSAHLQRFLDRRKRGLELDTEDAARTRLNRAEYWAQRNRSSGIQNYDSAYDDEYKHNGVDEKGRKTNRKLRTTRSARIAKEALTSQMAADNATRDASHILSGYGEFHNRTKQDTILGKKAADTFIEMDRTLRTEENDSFADQDWLMGKYDAFRKAGEDSYAYKHYIIGGAGALGKTGESLVLGEVIAKSAQNEAKRKSYVGLNFAKYGYNKSDARDCITGYSVNDDGFAVDRVTRKPLSSYTDPKTGKTIKIKERVPGEFLKYHPEYLEQCAYTLKDEKGYYFNATDQDGKFVARIYKNDGAALKEIFQNWDMPINDPINGLYGILSGVKPGALKNAHPALADVGLSNFSTTLQRAMLSSKFKEKAAFASPLYATMVGNRDIQDFVHQELARLDSINKTAKPSNFNTQDAAEFKHLQMLMDPDNWDWMLFNEESLRSFRNINRQKLTGTRYKKDANGNYIKNSDGSYAYDEIAADSADLTFDDLKNTVIRKFLAPAGPKFATLMSRVTQNVKDNQKPGVAEPWSGTLDSLEKWTKDGNLERFPGLVDPYAEQLSETTTRAREVDRRIRPKKQGDKQQGSKQPAHLSPNQNIPIKNQEIVKASPELQARKEASQSRASGKFTRIAEDIANDVEYSKFERSQPWYAYAGKTNFQEDYIQGLQHLADSIDDQRLFISAAEEYINQTFPNDERFSEAFDDFRYYADLNYTDNTQDLADTLSDIISTRIFEE